MRKPFFYSHLIEAESVIIELDTLRITSEQKLHLAELIDSSLHHTILDAVLSELSSQDKKIFLNYLKEDDSEKIWQFLNEKVSGIEEKIKKAAELLTLELKKDLKEVKKK